MYINASWLTDMRIFVIPYDDAVYKIGRERNEAVFTQDNAKLFAAEGKLDGLCSYCNFQGACNTVTASRVPEATKALNKKQIDDQDQNFVDSLTPLVVQRNVLSKEAKTTKLSLETINEQIRQALISQGKSRVVGGDWKVTYTAQAGRRTLSKALMLEDGIDPDKYMQEGGSFEKLTVTVA
jgi:hypothetical protein